MPELPEITVYQERMQDLLVGTVLRKVRLRSHFLLRSVAPPLTTIEGESVLNVSRSGKQLILRFAGERFAVIHLMITGRLRWKQPGAALSGRNVLSTNNSLSSAWPTMYTRSSGWSRGFIVWTMAPMPGTPK